jgi:hypothetical protein
MTVAANRRGERAPADAHRPDWNLYETRLRGNDALAPTPFPPASTPIALNEINDPAGPDSPCQPAGAGAAAPCQPSGRPILASVRARASKPAI